MEITSDFECGNIIVKEVAETVAQLEIRKDTNAGYFQWFYFRVDGDAGVARTFRLVNAGKASYPNAWHDYDVLATYDHESWERVPSEYDGDELVFVHQAEQSSTTYAFFVPYFEAQREALIQFCDAAPIAKIDVIGNSLNGKPLHRITIGDADADRKIVWIVTRQHAGEPMAEYATEGLVRYLLDADNNIAQALLQEMVFYIVPNMNPDGSYAGNLRANAAGVDLNRAWDKPSDQCPEIVAVRDAIAASGVDYFFDIHGDEDRPFIWLIGPQTEIPQDIADVIAHYEEELNRVSYHIEPPPESITSNKPSDLGMSVDYIAATYGCPAWIFELPFKAIPDEYGNADSLLADGCMTFGRHCIDALYSIVVE